VFHFISFNFFSYLEVPSLLPFYGIYVQISFKCMQLRPLILNQRHRTVDRPSLINVFPFLALSLFLSHCVFQACLIVHDFQETMWATIPARRIWIRTETDQTLATAIDPQIGAELSVLNAAAWSIPSDLLFTR